MKLQNNFLKSFLLILFASALLTGCQEMNSKMEEQLDNLSERAEELDSAVNKGLNKVDELDSIVNARTKRIKNLDSIVRKTTTRIDSLVNEKTSEINRQLN